MSLIRDLDLRRLGLGRVDRLLGRVEPGLLAVERGAASLGQGLLDVVILHARWPCARGGLRVAFELDLGELQLAVGLGDAASTSSDLASCSATVAWARASSASKCDGIHLGDDLAGMDHVALVNEDRLDAARLLGRHVHLDRFDPPVARGEPRR